MDFTPQSDVEILVSAGPALDTKQRVKEATDIVDLIGGYLQLRRQGAAYVAHCPWHDDQRPSLQVNPARQSWVCWVCDIRGDVFDFVMRRESVEFREALEILAQRAGIPLSLGERRPVKGSPQDKTTLYQAMAWAESQYHRCLLESEAAIAARDYLSARGVSDDCIRDFRLGFAPVAWSWLTDRARSTDFSPEVLQACDLVSESQYGSWNNRFRGRLMFPIRDTLQRPIAMGGRLIPGLLPEEEERRSGKYINSRETRLFSKSDTLYGLNLVRDQVARTRQLTIVEGYTDVIAAWQAGLRNVVGALGTAINERHIRVIKRFADQITLVLDGDTAGQTRANQILDLFVALDVDLRIFTLPEGQDPFDFLQREGGAAFQHMIDAAPDAIQHKINCETEGVDLINDSHRANQALNNILATIARIPASVFSGSAAKVLRRDQLLNRLARQFHVDREQVRRRLFELRKEARTQVSTGGPRDSNDDDSKIEVSQLDPKEKELLQLLVTEESVLDTAVENLAPDQLAEGPLRELYEVICEGFHRGHAVNIDWLMLELEQPPLKNLLVYLHEQGLAKQEANTSQPDSGVSPEQQLTQIMGAFNDMVAEGGNRSTISRLQQGKLNDQEEASTLEELLEKTKQRQGIPAPTDGLQP